MMKSLVFAFALFCCSVVFGQTSSMFIQANVQAVVSEATSPTKVVTGKKQVSANASCEKPCKPSSCDPSECPPECPPCPTGTQAKMSYASATGAESFQVVKAVYQKPIAAKKSAENCPPGCCKK